MEDWVCPRTLGLWPPSLVGQCLTRAPGGRKVLASKKGRHSAKSLLHGGPHARRAWVAPEATRPPAVPRVTKQSRHGVAHRPVGFQA